MIRQIWLAECASSPFSEVHTRYAASQRPALGVWIAEQGWQLQGLSGTVTIDEILWRKYIHATGGDVLYMRTSMLGFIDE